MRVRPSHPARGAGTARLAGSVLTRATPWVLVGLALAGGLWLGLIPLALRLYGQRRSLAEPYVCWLVDGLLLALNAALLTALVKVDGRERPK